MCCNYIFSTDVLPHISSLRDYHTDYNMSFFNAFIYNLAV
jgi:hypothetical protein